MNGMGLREKAVMAMLGAIVLYAIAVATWFLSAESAWTKAARTYDRAQQKYRDELKLIAEEDKWTEAYEIERATMPTFASGKSTDTSWLRKLGEIAKKHRIQIGQSEARDEIDAGDVMELPLDASFEGSLDAIVHFMHEVENSDSGMFAITKLNFKPSSKKGYFRGTFTLNCAYMRD